jgi:uncharacterized RDD family membrane protein YckC
VNPPGVGAPAGIITRLLAAVIDALVVAALTAALFGAVVAVAFLINPLSFTWPHNLAGEAGLVALAVAVVYLTVGWATAGRTVGGAVLGVRVVSRGGGRLGWARSLGRAVLYVLFPLGLLWAAVSARRRSVQDLLFRSSVRYDAHLVPLPTEPVAR